MIICFPTLPSRFKTDPTAWYLKEPTDMAGQEKQPPLTATQAEEQLKQALAKPAPLFPFGHRDRWEIAYCLLVWELFKILDSNVVTIPRDQIIHALAKAAGELS